MQLTQSDLDRFWKKVDKTEECWKWLASKKPGPYGYGQFRLGEITNYAHRASYIIANGSIPEGMDLIHLCKHYWCVNPKHLKVIDRVSRLNGVDGWQARENAKKTHCPKGHPYEEGNINKTMIKNQGWRACLICQKEKTQNYKDPEYRGKREAWRHNPKVKAAKKKYDKERYLRMMELIKKITVVDVNEALTIEEDEIKGSKQDWLKEASAYQGSGDPYKITDTPQKVRIENRRQKKLIAKIEDYKCQLCGWFLEWKNPKGKIVHRIDIDHIVEKRDRGTEQSSNLWALCPNCHVKKTIGVITIDLAKKRITENGKEIRLLSDNHLRWY